MIYAHCVTVRDPWHPHASRELRALDGPGPLAALAPRTRQPFVILRNGEAVLRADWDLPVERGDLIAVVLLPQGGGDSNPLRMLLMLAVAVWAPQLGALAYESAVGATAVTSLGSTIAQAVAGVMGTMLVNALIPPPKPPTPHQAASLAAPSPTYHLQAQGNMARLDQAIPVQYGRMMAFPDFAAQPYAEYAGNEQYLYQLLCLGQGEYDIEAIRIEDTPIANFAEISYEIVPPGASITLFPSNVASSGEVSGQECAGMLAATYVQVGTLITITLTAHNIAPGKTVYLDVTSGTATDGAYTVTAAPTPDTFTVTAAASATTSGNVNVQRYLGPFTANAAHSSANALGLDFVASRGLYHAELDGSLTAVSVELVVEARPIDDGGAPLGAWSVLGSETISDKTTTPQRLSKRYAVAAGRYEVRVRRADTKQTDAAYGHEMLWAGLRAYLPETRYFGDVTLIAMRLRASNNLSLQASRKINVIATRKLPVWTGSAWSAPTATRSIAWALADACRNTTYGARLADARIDLAGLLALDAVWTARGDEFNGRFDAALSFWEALTRIAVAGRAKPYMQGGVVRIARDAAASVPVALFSMRNIVRGSLSIDYVMPTPETADAVEVNYFDANYWAPQRVTATLSGGTSAQPAKVDLFGVTSRAQAWREGLYQAASNRYRRRAIRFATEMEGFIPSIGDLIAIQHDMPAWGQHAEATAWDAGTRTLTLSEPPTWGDGTHYVGLRTKAGGVDGPYVVTPGAQADQVILQTAPAAAPYTGSAYERTHVVFGWGETWRQAAKVVAVRPRGLYQVEIEAINEDPAVHTAEAGLTPPAVQTSQLTTRYTSPALADLTQRSSSSDPQKALLTWTPAPGAENYQIEMAQGTDPYATGISWTRVGETTANNFAVTALYGAQTLIRVRGVGLTVGAWITLFYGETADYMWTDDAALMWHVDDSTLMWRY